MATGNKAKNVNQAASGSKKIRIYKIASIIVIFLLILIILAPSIISMPFVTSFIKDRLAGSLDAEIEINHLRVTWLDGITIEGLSYADNNGIIVDAQKVFVKVNYISLLSGIVDVTEGLIENAAVTLVADENNPRPVTDTAAKAVAAFIPDSSPVVFAQEAAVDLQITKFNYIRTAAIDLMNVGIVLELIKKDGTRQNFELSGIEGKIRINPPGETSGIDLKAKTPGKNSSMTLYVLAARPEVLFIKDEFSSVVKLNISGLDLASLAPLLYMAKSDNSLAGNLDFTLDAEVEKGLLKRCRATANSKQIDFAGSDAKKIVIMDLVSSVKLTTDKNFIQIRELMVNSEWLNFEIDGQIPLTPEGIDTMFDSTSTASLSGKFNARLSKALEQFPDIFGHSGMTVRSGDITGKISTSSVGAGKVFYGNMSLTNFSASDDEKTLKLNTPITLRAEVLARPDGILIDPIELSSMFMNISCSGMVDDLKIQGSIPLKAAQAELGSFIDFGPYDYSGEIVLNADLMPKSKILTGTVFLRDFTSTNRSGRMISEPYADLSFGIKHEPVEDKIWITSMFFKSVLLGEFELLQGYLNMKEDSAEKFVTLFKMRSSIAKIFDVLAVYDKKPEDIDVSGQFSTTTKLVFGKENLRISSEDTGISDMTVKTPTNNYHTAGIAMKIDADLNQGQGVYNVNSLRLRNEWAALNFSKCNFISKDGYSSIDAAFELSYDLETMSNIEKFFPEDFVIKGAKKSNCYVKTSYPAEDTSKAMANLDASIGLGFDSIDYMGLAFGTADIKAVVTGGKLVVEPFSIPLNEGSVNFGATSDLSASPIVLNINKDTRLINAVAINDELADGLLKYINPIFSDSLNTKGQMNLLSRQMAIPLVGDIAAGISADTQISIDNAVITPSGLLGQILELIGKPGSGLTSFGIEPTDMKIADKTVFCDNMVMFLANKKLSFKGSTGFDGKINMDVTLPFGYSIDGKEYPEISLPIDGNVTSPRIDTRKILEKNTEAIGDVIEKAIDKNVDDETGKLIKEGLRGLQDLLKTK